MVMAELVRMSSLYQGILEAHLSGDMDQQNRLVGEVSPIFERLMDTLCEVVLSPSELVYLRKVQLLMGVVAELSSARLSEMVAPLFEPVFEEVMYQPHFVSGHATLM